MANQSIAVESAVEMKLHTLKPRLQGVNSRLTTHAPTRPDTVQRVRGWKGVQDRNRIRARDGGECQQCIRDGCDHISLGVDVDHIIPLWDGGRDDDGNKELLCDEHHKAKSAKEATRRAR
jgi:5-methylcytosine-specific restriction protein A